MFNSVQFVRDLCKQKKIPVAKIERDLGYGNGYFNAKKQVKLPYERAVEIAEYLSVSPELILTGEEGQKNNAPGKFSPTEDEQRILIALRKKTPEELKALSILLGIDLP